MRLTITSSTPLLVLQVILVASEGCIPPCSKDLAAGRSYKLTLIERYDEMSRFYHASRVRSQVDAQGRSCSAFDGLGPGSTLEIRTTGLVDVGGSCEPLSGVVSVPPAQVVITRTFPGSGTATSGGLVGIAHQVKVGECMGDWLLELNGAQGRSPPLTLYRGYGARMGPCQSCDDAFVVFLGKP